MMGFGYTRIVAPEAVGIAVIPAQEAREQVSALGLAVIVRARRVDALGGAEEPELREWR